MREVEFRGKFIKNNNWIYGYYIKYKTRQTLLDDDELELNEIKHLIAIDSIADWNKPRHVQIIEIKGDTVGQYTGVSDINKKKIFEGDIVKGYIVGGEGEEKVHGEVVFDCGSFCVDNGCYQPCLYEIRELEIVGNVFDFKEGE